MEKGLRFRPDRRQSLKVTDFRAFLVLATLRSVFSTFLLYRFPIVPLFGLRWLSLWRLLKTRHTFYTKSGRHALVSFIVQKGTRILRECFVAYLCYWYTIKYYFRRRCNVKGSGTSPNKEHQYKRMLQTYTFRSNNTEVPKYDQISHPFITCCIHHCIGPLRPDRISSQENL